MRPGRSTARPLQGTRGGSTLVQLPCPAPVAPRSPVAPCSRTWVRSSRAVGRQANVSGFKVQSNEGLHDALWALPLFPGVSCA
ncbi:muconolactone Delta-isomerase family protein [Streptomyces sp. NPDC048248]|uniref:muconolactone Delta-isomerase family protein n=1 Tax=Streptomyces sp. NPDC048248 TaxID=3365523 RepID=UPI003724C505